MPVSYLVFYMKVIFGSSIPLAHNVPTHIALGSPKHSAINVIIIVSHPVESTYINYTTGSVEKLSQGRSV